MTSKYQVYGCVAPSGGMFAASEQMFETEAEAEIEALRLLGEVDDFWTHDTGGKEFTYPAYWAQKIEEREDGNRYIVFE